MIQRSLFNVAEISLMTGVSVAEIYREIKAGRLRADVINGRKRARIEDIETWLARPLQAAVAT